MKKKLGEGDDLLLLLAHLLVLLDGLLEIGEEARRDAVATFGSRCVLKQYIDLYDRVLAAPTAR